MKIQDSNFMSVRQIQEQYLNKSLNIKKNKQNETISFQDILKQKVDENGDNSTLHFSKHANIRLQERGIYLSETQMERLEDGAKRAEEKGIKDSLMIMDELTFIVNIPNNTVITAMERTETENNIFTNIDGAVII